jgi:ADP-ribosyltransferase exoenzyme
VTEPLVMTQAGKISTPLGLGLADFKSWLHPRGGPKNKGQFTKKLGQLKAGSDFTLPGGDVVHHILARANDHSYVEHPNAEKPFAMPHDTDVIELPPTTAPKQTTLFPGVTPKPFPTGGGTEYKPPPPPPPPKPVGTREGEPSLVYSKAAGGSNGAYFATADDGRKWLVKSYRGNQDRVATELLANSIYRALGFTVADAQIVHDQQDRPVLTYPLLDGKTQRIPKPSAELGKGFMADALTANWDVVGLADDNILWSPEGDPIRIDQGGTFQFRAMGEKKPYGPVPTEVWSMRGLKKSGEPTQAQRGMLVTEADMRTQAARIAKTLTPQKIATLVNAAPFKNQEMRREVEEALRERVQWMGRFAKGEEQIPRPPDGDAADSLLREPVQLYEGEPEDLKAVLGSDDINAALRKKDQSQPEPEVAGRLDALFKEMKFPATVTTYRGLDAKLLPDPASDLVGQTFTDHGFATVSTSQGDIPKGAVMRIVVPEGTKALYLNAADPSFAPGEIMMRRGSRFKVTGVEKIKGKVVVDAQVIK